MKRIAIIEDDRGLNMGIVLALKSQQFDFAQYYSLKEAAQVLEPPFPDLILLDINFPDGNGLDFLQKIRSRTPVPVIIITANDEEMSQVAGLELGADDYIVKPFSLMVLRARISNVLRKASSSLVFSSENFLFDFENMQFFKKGCRLELSKTEQRLLRLLVENRGMTLSREFLMDRIWTDGAEYVDENALSVTVKRLRDKLEDHSTAPRYIHTVYRQGYVWKEEET